MNLGVNQSQVRSFESTQTITWSGLKLMWQLMQGMRLIQTLMVYGGGKCAFMEKVAALQKATFGEVDESKLLEVRSFKLTKLVQQVQNKFACWTCRTLQNGFFSQKRLPTTACYRYGRIHLPLTSRDWVWLKPHWASVSREFNWHILQCVVEHFQPNGR